MEKHSKIDFDSLSKYIPEIKFYLEITDFTQKANTENIPFCFPKISAEIKYEATALYDVSLFAKNCKTIIPNNALFTPEEPFFFLTGANGGGKTTYIRAVCINLILFLSGCPIFAENASIYPFETVFTHFPTDERFDVIGRLDEEKLRVEKLLKSAHGKTSFLLFNETFSGTDEEKGFKLLTELSEQIKDNKHYGIYVTHFHKVSQLYNNILTTVVKTSDSNLRTFRIVKAQSSNSSYAADILKKYRLDKESLNERMSELGV